MLKNFPELLFVARGRVARAAYFWTMLGMATLFVVLFVFLDAVLGRTATWVLYPPFFWIAFALAAKRLHDAGQSAAWLLALAIPVLGPLWMAYCLLLRKGSPGENQYGPDPLEFGDYLAVDIHQLGGAK